MKQKLLSTAYWTIPCIFCLVLYWPGLLAWFQQDDFVWLNLQNQTRQWTDLLKALFQPTTHGTWRPLSERVYFLVFGNLFGADALPYRIWVFLTMFANLVLVESVVARMTRSRAAAFWAAILWVANAKLATAMSWSSEYILVACGFFLLLALHFFLRYTETGERRYYRLTWAVFLTGFLAMETNIVFPALAGSYALLFARKYFRRTLPFFAASAVYGILHVWLAPSHGNVLYTMHFDRAIPSTLWSYWRQTFEPIEHRRLSVFPTFWTAALTAAVTIALVAFTIQQVRHKRWLGPLLFSWYFIALSPVVPLRDHVMDYYLTLPAMCLAMLGGYALSWAWRAGPDSKIAWKIVSVAVAAAFVIEQVPVARLHTEWYRRRSETQEALVMGVARAHELHPNKVILLEGVDDELFWGAVQQSPFQFLRIRNVYLAPGSETAISPQPQVGDVSEWVLPADKTIRGLDADQIMVYRVGKGPLRNITQAYQPPAPPPTVALPRRIDMGDPLVTPNLGPGWYAFESGYRWMARTASVRMAGPRTAGQKLYVTATCPSLQLSSGPLPMTVTVDGVRVGSVKLTRADRESTFEFPLPPETTGKDQIAVAVEVGRTVRAGADIRDLGLNFGRFEIR